MREKYESLSAAVLRDLAKSRGLKNLSGLKKAELIDVMVAEEIKQEEKHIPLAGVCKHLMVTFERPLEKEKVGYTTTKVNLRQKPTTNSEIIKTLSINTKIKYYDYDDKWIELIDGKGYISKDYISDTKTKIKTFTLPKNHLTKYNGVCYYNGRRESYYNLPMSQVIKYMHDLGFEGEYTIRCISPQIA